MRLALSAAALLVGGCQGAITSAKQTEYDKVQVVNDNSNLISLLDVDGKELRTSAAGDTYTFEYIDGNVATIRECCAGATLTTCTDDSDPDDGVSCPMQVKFTSWRKRYEESTVCCRDQVKKDEEWYKEYKPGMTITTTNTNPALANNGGTVIVKAEKVGEQFTYVKVGDGPVVLLDDPSTAPTDGNGHYESESHPYPDGSKQLVACSFITNQKEVCFYASWNDGTNSWDTPITSSTWSTPRSPPAPPSSPPDPPFPPYPNLDGAAEGLGAGAIAGIVIGVIVFLILVAVITVRLKRKKQEKAAEPAEVQVSVLQEGEH